VGLIKEQNATECLAFVVRMQINLTIHHCTLP